MTRSRVSPLAYGQVKAIEEHRDQLADELRKAIAEVERLAHVTQQQAALINAQRAEIDRLCAMLGEADSRTTRPRCITQPTEIAVATIKALNEPPKGKKP